MNHQTPYSTLHMRWLKGRPFPVVILVSMIIILENCASRSAIETDEQDVTLHHMQSANLYATGTWFFEDTVFNVRHQSAHQYHPVTMQVRHASARATRELQLKSLDTTSISDVQKKQHQSEVGVYRSQNQYHLTPITTLLVLGFIAIFVLVLVKLHRKTLGYRKL